MSMEDIKEVVKEKYGQAALRARTGKTTCCESAAPASACCDPISSNLYSLEESGKVPEAALRASLGCGNPTALAELKPGEVVLDLGSGGGIDVLLSARRVGPSGKAYGLDMTDEMLELARENQKKAGVANAEFLKGEIENIPLPDNSVDVIISNCVINLSADKDKVLREAFRVLKPGGRFAVSDVVTRGHIPAEIRASVLLWVGCVAGALDENEYRTRLAAAGFQDVDLEPTRIYRAEDARAFLEDKGMDIETIGTEVDGKVLSAFIRATKPAATAADAGSRRSNMLNPRHADSWSSFYASTKKGTVLDERTMVLIGLAASIAVDCEPCAEAYLAQCNDHGISDAEIADVLAKVMAVSAGKRKIKLSRTLDRMKKRR